MPNELNKIPGSKLEPLAKSLLNSFGELEFGNLTNAWDERFNFERLKPNVAGSSFQDSLPFYLRKLKARGKLHPFILFLLADETCKTIWENDPDGIIFKSYLDEIFIILDGQVEVRAWWFNQLLISNGDIPFINRHEFRQIVQDLLLNEQLRQVAFVNGLERSGMSYLGKYLDFICSRTALFSYYEVDVSYYLRDVSADESGIELAECISSKLGLNIDFSLGQRDKIKFITFITRFNEFVEESDRVPVIFLHDFHKVPNTLSVNRFMYEFISHAVKQTAPEFNLIIAGYNCEDIHNWHSDLKFSSRRCAIAAVLEEDLRNILIEIYDQKRDVIVQKLDGDEDIEEIEYVEKMLEIIKGDNGTTIDKIPISEIGNALRAHLYQLTN